MKYKPERSVDEWYDDPERADALLWQRRTDKTRRGFLRGAGYTALTAALGAPIVFGRHFPGGLIPAALAEESDAPLVIGKEGLLVLNDLPLNAETPAHLLNDAVTPTSRHFVRNNGVPPASVDSANWRLKISGACERPLTLSIADLQREFEIIEPALQIECGGNGRAGVYPGASGNQWTHGAIANARWRGVRLGDVLQAAGLRPEAQFTGHIGADTHLSGDPVKQPLSRGVPIAKALDPGSIIAFGMNGENIHPMNGAPLRLVIPGWPGSCSQKWLTEIVLSESRWRGAKMAPPSYSVPREPVIPGAQVANEAFTEIQSMPVKSLITSPKNAIRLPPGKLKLAVSGHAWAGDRTVDQVDLTVDFGATWQPARLGAPPNPYAWQAFAADIRLPRAGYYEIWARATDSQGTAQPFASAWNPKGYLNNSMHRIAVIAEPSA